MSPTGDGRPELDSQVAADAAPGGEVRLIVRVTGTVQGVGFRPHVYGLARRLGLRGYVLNSSAGVVIEVEGDPGATRRFVDDLQRHQPRLARIASVTVSQAEPCGYTNFVIRQSREGAVRRVVIPPDVATCGDCRAEVFDPADRHFDYPFTNCTNCGPRYTIIRDLPYDRPKTTMAPFPMCPDCRGEYGDPGDRRFHAQPVACPACGPRVRLVGPDGREVSGDWPDRARERLRRGDILAVKGLGGFHLACDAASAAAVRELRHRKRRPAKPLAVMCRDLEVARRICRVSDVEADLLASPQAPIVICDRRPGVLPDELAPGLLTLGLMLPYTPLHLLLLADAPDVLVMTSGNVAGLPLVIDDRRALAELGGIADWFLVHDREIHGRCDDSVARVFGGEAHLYRRSRGYVPEALETGLPGSGPAVLAVGGEMKNAVCLLHPDGRAFLGPHLGDLDTVEGLESFDEARRHLESLLDIRPEVVARDAHPEYAVSRRARQLPAREHVAVQHHHAHLVSCLVDNLVDGPAIGLICDGTGYGEDGTIWGGEVLVGDAAGYERALHLRPVPLPGGEGAIRVPLRMAVSYLTAALGPAEGASAAGRLFPGRDSEVRTVAAMAARGINAPLTSSCGRLFDAVSAMCGVCVESTYEGQAAIELGDLALSRPEAARRRAAADPYPLALDERIIDTLPLVRTVLSDLEAGTPAFEVAVRFHAALVRGLAAAADSVRRRTGLAAAVLSGGVFANEYLLLELSEELLRRGFRVHYHRRVPAGDGGLALGQAAVARWRWSQCVSPSR